jgi:enolase-phosphatase E1
LFSEHFDTTIGSKREASSYTRIAEEVEIRPADIVFLTDVVPEVDAATAAGLQVITCVRPNNAPLPRDYDRPTVHSFDEIDLRVPS